MTASYHARVGVDIGGTFTDLVLLRADGETAFAKVSSTPDAPERAVLEGVGALLSAGGVSPAAIDEVVHGTTVGSNTLLQRKGAETGLVTTKGFRDVLEIGRLRTPDMFDLGWDKPEPLIRRRHRREVTERIDADGAVITPLDEAGLLREVATLRSEGVRSLAVCFLNSYLAPAHEQRAGVLLAEHFPDLAVSLSIDVLAEAREYERTSTVAVNAYVWPVLADYLARLESGLLALGIRAPLRVANSNGGLSAVATARAKPVFFISSGRAAGVAGAGHLGRAAGRRNLIVFDMGGTTASASLVHEGELSRLQEYEFRAGISTPSRFIKAGGFLMRVPTVDVAEVGSGAGSIAHLDAGGLLKVGPVSAGAAPGPACYGIGGTAPTVTDANLLLGYLPTRLAGGELELDVEAAAGALERAVAGPLGMATRAAASGVRRIVNDNMGRVIRAVTVERGVDPRDFSLLAFGGSGPVHACDLADDIGITEVIFPPMPGVFTAAGMLAGDVERYFIHALPGPLAELDPGRLQMPIEDLRAEAKAALAEEGAGTASLEFQLDLRFMGQDSQLPVPLPDAPGADIAALMRERFLDAYRRTHRYASADAVEMVNLRLVARAERVTRLDFAAIRGGKDQGGAQTTRSVHLADGAAPRNVPVIARAALAGEARGPAILESADCTIVIPPGWRAAPDEFANIVARADGRPS